MHALEWILPPDADEQACRCLAEHLGVPPFIAKILCQRGFSAPDDAALFLDPRLKTLRDPFLLPNLERAIERLLVAIDARERIVLYGDYDVDGVTSLALLTRILRAYGADVACFLPLRVDEGYGLSTEGITRCLETLHPRLLVAVDCGTSSVAEIDRLTRAGVDTIVFDHHTLKETAPACLALVNPKLGCEGHELCSAGVVFKAAHALLKRRPCPGIDLRHYLDLVALGTVADVVPLERENRILVKRGLLEIARSRWPGVTALVNVSGAKAPFTPGDVGFKFGPRLNAAGRLGTAQDALDLLLTDDPARAQTLAQSLNLQNQDRRSVEESVLAEAEAQLAESYDAASEAAVVVGARGWHPGVVGIVASRLMRRFHRPTLVAGFDENGVGKGSGRSIAGYSLVAALQACGSHLTKHGGHEMAAGFALEWPRFEEFRAAFLAHARQTLGPDQLRPRLQVDGVLTLREIGFDLLSQHDSLQPFGTGNPQPLFIARRLRPAAEPRVLKEKHLSLRLEQNGHVLRAIWFGGAAEPLPPPPWDVAFRIERNEYDGKVLPQLEVRAVRGCPM